MGELVDATLLAIKAAKALVDMDKGTVAALLILAKKIDQEDERWEYALAYSEEHKMKPPPHDNVSLPTYLRYCEALGLTPSGRAKLKPATGAEGGSKLAQLRSVNGGKSA